MEKDRLVGSDGKLVTVKLDSEVTGDGTKSLDELVGGEAASGEGAGWWSITAVGQTSAFASVLENGELFWDDGSLVPELGDACAFLAESEKADIQSFSIDFNKNEIDVTTLSDKVKRYRSGKTDMTGGLEGLTTLDVTDAAGYVINNFIKVIRQSASGTIIKNDVDGSPIYIKGVIQKSTDKGEKEAFIWAKVIILSSSLGASGEDAQNFSSSFRIAPGDPDPTLYIREAA
jgi:hypothetical protein